MTYLGPTLAETACIPLWKDEGLWRAEQSCHALRETRRDVWEERLWTVSTATEIHILATGPIVQSACGQGLRIDKIDRHESKRQQRIVGQSHSLVAALPRLMKALPAGSHPTTSAS